MKHLFCSKHAWFYSIIKAHISLVRHEIYVISTKLIYMNEAVCYGEILWDVTPSGEQPGGAPMNVAYHLQKLGIPSGVISRRGSDTRGDELVALLDSYQISTKYVQQDHYYPTGLVHAHLKEGNQVEYDIVRPVAWDYIEMKSELLSLVTNARYFVFGSLASRNEVSRNN